MHSFASLPVIATFLAATVSAHGYVSDATIGGTTYTGYLPYSDPYYSVPPQRIFRKIPGNGPVEDVTSVDLQCNGYQNSGSAPAPLTATAAAGSTVSLHWTTWPDSHHGPVITYMAKCPGSCTTYSPGTAAVWFKIKEEGKRSDGTWASDDFITGKTYTFTIPKTLVAGNYIVRHEILALHSAYSYPGVQFYPSCFQVTVTGGGSATGPSSKVAFPGAYTPTTPGIVFDIYQGTGAYPIPGPAVWSG
ncbi:glycoside hydrolase family 61 protein [Pyronema domesticum]|uniref:lytic cellulose monooxygenase (C4-dehydrogenating) n=1 Tax=Pyronema omphalodes (strain CBS 100304) TaxID=1076935 RepID=U4L5K7_PYROM|nr:glycoside hydrolase family 61 protein [Pyronema domesticum]CCX07706.1 Similar to Probable endo-beta-1,4-glucanase D; acc. no. Q2US83 [Pyronema omphalodes CBS 100304]